MTGEIEQLKCEFARLEAQPKKPTAAVILLTSPKTTRLQQRAESARSALNSLGVPDAASQVSESVCLWVDGLGPEGGVLLAIRSLRVLAESYCEFRDERLSCSFDHLL